MIVMMTIMMMIMIMMLCDPLKVKMMLCDSIKVSYENVLRNKNMFDKLLSVIMI